MSGETVYRDRPWWLDVLLRGPADLASLLARVAITVMIAGGAACAVDSGYIHLYLWGRQYVPVPGHPDDRPAVPAPGHRRDPHRPADRHQPPGRRAARWRGHARRVGGRPGHRRRGRHVRLQGQLVASLTRGPRSTRRSSAPCCCSRPRACSPGREGGQVGRAARPVAPPELLVPDRPALAGRGLDHPVARAGGRLALLGPDHHGLADLPGQVACRPAATGRRPAARGLTGTRDR